MTVEANGRLLLCLKARHYRLSMFNLRKGGVVSEIRWPWSISIIRLVSWSFDQIILTSGFPDGIARLRASRFLSLNAGALLTLVQVRADLRRETIEVRF